MTWHPEIDRALAELRAKSDEAASDASAALGWLVGEGGPEVLSEGRLQEFLWFVLPRKFLMPADDQLGVAHALGRTLDLLGLPRYAEMCRSPRTEDILRSWEKDEGAGLEASRRALFSSVVEPPDAGDLRWGAVMGPWESRAMEGLSAALELAAQAGEIRRGGRGWREAKHRFAWRWLSAPQPGFDSSPYERVVRERLKDWAGRGPSRRALLGPLADRLVPPVSPPEDPTTVVGVLQWLLVRVRTGIALTAKGNLNRAFVRKAARELGWQPSEFFEPTGEGDVPPLLELHHLARSIMAVRRSGRNEALTQKGARWASDGEDLWRTVARHLTEGEGWEAAVAELALAVVVARPQADVAGIAEEIAPALIESGWRERGWRTGDPVQMDPRAVRETLWSLIRKAEVLGLLQRRPSWEDGTASLSGAGRVTALEALRAKGIAPRTRP